MDLKVDKAAAAASRVAVLTGLAVHAVRVQEPADKVVAQAVVEDKARDLPAELPVQGSLADTEPVRPEHVRGAVDQAEAVAAARAREPAARLVLDRARVAVRKVLLAQDLVAPNPVNAVQEPDQELAADNLVVIVRERVHLVRVALVLEQVLEESHVKAEKASQAAVVMDVAPNLVSVVQGVPAVAPNLVNAVREVTEAAPNPVSAVQERDQGLAADNLAATVLEQVHLVRVALALEQVLEESLVKAEKASQAAAVMGVAPNLVNVVQEVMVVALNLVNAVREVTEAAPNPVSAVRERDQELVADNLVVMVREQVHLVREALVQVQVLEESHVKAAKASQAAEVTDVVPNLVSVVHGAMAAAPIPVNVDREAMAAASNLVSVVHEAMVAAANLVNVGQERDLKVVRRGAVATEAEVLIPVHANLGTVRTDQEDPELAGRTSPDQIDTGAVETRRKDEASAAGRSKKKKVDLVTDLLTKPSSKKRLENTRAQGSKRLRVSQVNIERSKLAAEIVSATK